MHKGFIVFYYYESSFVNISNTHLSIYIHILTGLQLQLIFFMHGSPPPANQIPQRTLMTPTMGGSVNGDHGNNNASYNYDNEGNEDDKEIVTRDSGIM